MGGGGGEAPATPPAWIRDCDQSRRQRSSISPITAGPDYIRFFIFDQNIKKQLLNMFKINRDVNLGLCVCSCHVYNVYTVYIYIYVYI